MSDNVILVTIFCTTSLGMAAMFFFSTYKKEKLELKTKASIKDLIDTEIAVTAEDKKSKK